MRSKKGLRWFGHVHEAIDVVVKRNDCSEGTGPFRGRERPKKPWLENSKT